MILTRFRVVVVVSFRTRENLNLFSMYKHSFFPAMLVTIMSTLLVQVIRFIQEHINLETFLQILELDRFYTDNPDRRTGMIGLLVTFAFCCLLRGKKEATQTIKGSDHLDPLVIGKDETSCKNVDGKLQATAVDFFLNGHRRCYDDGSQVWLIVKVSNQDKTNSDNATVTAASSPPPLRLNGADAGSANNTNNSPLRAPSTEFLFQDCRPFYDDGVTTLVLVPVDKVGSLHEILGRDNIATSVTDKIQPTPIKTLFLDEPETAAAAQRSTCAKKRSSSKVAAKNLHSIVRRAL